MRPLCTTRRWRTSLALALLATIVVTAAPARADESVPFEIQNLQGPYKVYVGQNLTLTLVQREGAVFDPDKLTIQQNEFLEVAAKSATTLELLAKKAGVANNVALLYGGTLSVPLPPIQIVGVKNIRVTGLDPMTSLNVNDSITVEVREVRAADENLIPNARVTIDAGDSGAIKVNKAELAAGETFKLTAQKVTTTPAKLTLASNGVSRAFDVSVVDPIETIDVLNEPISLREGEKVSVEANVRTRGGQTVLASTRSDLQIILDGAAGPVDIVPPLQVQARSLGGAASASVRFEMRSTSNSTTVADDFTVNVVPAQGYVSVDRSVVPLLPGGTVTVKGEVRMRGGALDPSKQIKWSLANEADSKYVDLAPQGGVLTILRKGLVGVGENGEQVTPTPSYVKVVAAAVAPGSASVDESVTPANVFVSLADVAKFSPLNVRLDIMDERMAEDLYGKKTAQEYYVARVRLFNNLVDDESGENIGSSILAFSDSIEVAVGLEKMVDRKLKSALPRNAAPDDEKWHELTRNDLDFMLDPYFGEKHVEPMTQRTVLSRQPLVNRAQNEAVLFTTNDCVNAITYRPFSFEMVVNTVDRRDERSTRSKIFRGLNLAGSVASFVTAIGIPGSESDLPTGLEKYSHLFIPGLEKVFPSLKEAHRQNIVSQTMKPIEEIPFGSDLSRVVFLPKRPIHGLLPGHMIRISSICPYYFKIQVAVIRKDGRATIEQGAAPGR